MLRRLLKFFGLVCYKEYRESLFENLISTEQNERLKNENSVLQKELKLPMDRGIWISQIIQHCASLEIEVNQYVRMSPVTGMHGAVKLSGNSIPTFQYTVFDSSLMEFIIIRAHLSLPGHVKFDHEVIPTGNGPPEKPVPLKEEYLAPFYLLMRKLYHYFPFMMPEKKLNEVKTIVGDLK